MGRNALASSSSTASAVTQWNARSIGAWRVMRDRELSPARIRLPTKSVAHSCQKGRPLSTPAPDRPPYEVPDDERHAGPKATGSRSQDTPSRRFLAPGVVCVAE